MIADNRKYERVLNLLRKSKPVMEDAEAVTDRIMRQLQEEKSKISLTELIVEFMFGWVYIGWVRRAMVAATLVIVVTFGYQQALILKRIDELSGQRIQDGPIVMTNLKDDLTDKMLRFRLRGRKLPNEKMSVPQKDIDEMIKSINNLQVKYKDIFFLIENDPQLKKYVEDKINENKKSKI
jgi:uncharacterized protein YecE (DUF72 family)